ncbi:Disks large, partial [Intoshia linei]
MSPVCKEDTYRALELLESYYRQLHNTDDADLKEAIETVIRTFKSELFKTLLEIQEYYEKTLMNKDMSKEEKTIESMKLLDKHCTNSETYETCQKENSYGRAGEPINNVSNGVNRDTHRQVDYEQWKVVNVTLRRSETGFGFTIAGGVDSMHIPHDSGIFVASLIEGGAAMQDGRLQVNDVIMHVNNTNLNEITHEIAVEALRNAGNQIKLKVRRRIEYPQTVKICLYRGKMNLGFSIAGGSDQEHYPGDPSIYITKIIPNGVAELDNRLAVNDCITSVNNIDLTNVTHRESIEALRSSNIDPIILYVKKYSQDGYKNVDDADDNHIENNVFSNESQNVYSGNDSQIASKYSFNDQNESIEPMQFSDANYDTQQVLSTRSEQYFTKEIENNDSPDKIARSDSITVNMDNDISRSPRKVVLHRKSDEPSLGFNIVGGDNNSGIFISYITVGGLAAQNGGIYKGDTILSVNGTDLTEVNHEQAVLILKNCDGSNIEFILEYSPEELKRYNTSIFENNIFINQNIRLPSTTESIVSSKMIKKQILYVRTQFDYDPSKDSGLPGRGLQFSYGNILKVINSGDEEWWKAKLLFVENEQIGIIPGIKRVIKREKLRLRNVKFNNSTQSNIK